VREGRVFGVPDRGYGEDICDWIIPHAGVAPDEAQMRAFCDGAIARYKIPRIWRFVDSFPLTVTGQARKVVIRRMMEQELGAGQGGSAGAASPDP